MDRAIELYRLRRTEHWFRPLPVCEVSVIVVFMLALNSAVCAADTLHELEKMWRDGQADAVLALARDRLSRNPEDLPGLLLVLNYEVSFFQSKQAVNDVIERTIAAGACVQGRTFKDIYPKLVGALRYLQKSIGSISEEQLRKESARPGVKGKMLGNKIFLDALERDGLL